jgi:hypothetical protein
MRRAEPLAGLGGIALLVSLLLPWYGPPAAGWVSYGPGDDVPDTAWESFAVIDVLLALLALLAIAVPLVSLATRGPARSIGTAVLASALGWIGVLVVAFRLLDNPGPLRIGAWLALAGALLAWVGSWLSMRDESTPGAAAPELPRRPAPAP